MSYLGLDIGSSGCKAVIFSREGKELSSAYKEYSLISSQPGWAELDSNNVIKQCFAVIKEAALKCSDDQVMAMGISSQGEAFTPINPDGDFSGNGMISSGTVECFCPLLENPQFSDDLLKNNLCCYDFTIKDRYTTVAYSLTGGNILKWFRDNFGREEI